MSKEGTTMDSISGHRTQGRAFIQDPSERARFITYTRTHIMRWLDPSDPERTVKNLTAYLGVGPDQVARWLKGTAIPSRESAALLCARRVFPLSFEDLVAQKPWMECEPAPPAVNQGKTATPKKQKKQRARELPAEPVPTPENASSIFDALAQDSSISTSQKMAVAAIIALVQNGAQIAVEVTVRAR